VLQERRETVEEKLDARKEQLMLKGLAASFSIETGNDIVGSLMRVIKREKTDMVVISTHGMSGWHPLVFGSIAEQVIKQVNCTLLLLQSDQRVPAAEESAIEVWEDSFVPKVAVAGHLGSPLSESRISSQKRLDRAADGLAQRGGQAEQQYDQDHSLFTK
jgi:K+-sensing histidine kinase KdpD